MIKFSILNDWWTDHEYDPFDKYGKKTKRWTDRGPTTIFDSEHPIADVYFCPTCGKLHPHGVTCPRHMDVTPHCF
jgi:hypothetical protein